jgi:hypothetical protein
MDGEESTVIIGSDFVKAPNDLALDLDTPTLYFVDSTLDIIARTTTDGLNFTILSDVSNITGLDMSAPVYIDYYEGTLYFNERFEDDLYSLRVDVSGEIGPPVLLLSTLTREIGNIRVVDPDRRQPLVLSEL